MSKWGVVPDSVKWSNSASSPNIVRFVSFNVCAPVFPAIVPVIEFTLSEPVASGYFQDRLSINGYPIAHVHPFNHPYVVTGAAPYKPTAEGESHIWHSVALPPRQMAAKGPLHIKGVFQAYNSSGKLLGEMEYEQTTQFSE